GAGAPGGVAAGAETPTAAHAAVVPLAAAPAPSRLDKIGGPMGAAAVVLVALGVGFLIGQATNDTPPVQRAPVVNIEGGLPSGSTTAPASDLPAADGATDDATATGETPQATGTEDTGGDINRLRQQPTETETPGTAPPVDDEAAGGGTDAETIG
ncbi:hypothetical protein VSS74_31520, partial [Conexibacter stalactiti]